MVSADGINPLPDKLEAIRDWPVPHCLRDVRALLGLDSYYRRFVKGFATIAEPLTRLTHKMARFEWTEKAQQAFDALKQALVEAWPSRFLRSLVFWIWTPRTLLWQLSSRRKLME